MFLRASLYALGAGVVLSWVFIVLNYGLSALQDPLWVMFIGATSGGPAVLLASLVAGYLASRGASAKPPWTRAAWVRRGILAGAVTGGVTLGGWFVVMDIPYSVPLWLLAAMIGVGVIAGACAGALVARLCWARLQSQLVV